MKDCPFCAIVRHPETAHVVLDTQTCVAFLDRTPLFHGHVLLVPRSHVVTLGDLPEREIEPFFRCVQRLSRVLPAALGAQGSFVAMNNVVSQSVPHLHVHVVPRTKGDGLKGFFWPRTKYASDDVMREVADKIRTAIEAS